jgi:hypothetical protein
MLGEIAKMLIFFGLVLVALGLLLTWLPSLKVGRLPGDILVRREDWNLYIPITTSILLSVILSLLLWVIAFLRR